MTDDPRAAREADTMNDVTQTDVADLYKARRVAIAACNQAETELEGWFSEKVTDLYREYETAPIELCEHEVRASDEYAIKIGMVAGLRSRVAEASDAISVLNADIQLAGLDLSLQAAMGRDEVSTERARVEMLKNVNGTLDLLLGATRKLSAQLAAMAAEGRDAVASVGG